MILNSFYNKKTLTNINFNLIINKTYKIINRILNIKIVNSIYNKIILINKIYNNKMQIMIFMNKKTKLIEVKYFIKSIRYKMRMIQIKKDYKIKL